MFLYLCQVDGLIMSKPKGKDDFMRTPGYPGGDEAMKKFVAKNLRYPDEAKAKRIEGKVIVAYQVTDNGKVQKPHIIKGLGYGCDEEAMRVISLMRFEKVKNRKIRVLVTKRTSINFKIPRMKINYSVSSKDKSPVKKDPPDSGNKESSYTYTINIPNK